MIRISIFLKDYVRVPHVWPMIPQALETHVYHLYHWLTLLVFKSLAAVFW